MNGFGFTGERKIIAVLGGQWGDEGKGKIVDLLAEQADIIVRGTGGANAGHTIVHNSETFVFHLLPSGILYDGDGKLNIIGSGVAVDPRALAEEIAALEASGGTRNGLRISHRAHLVTPFDIVLDRLKEASSTGKIGTTGRGIGPTYESHLGRIGLTVNDLLNKDVLVAKLRRNLETRMPLFRAFHPLNVDRAFMGLSFYRGSGKEFFDIDEVVSRYLCCAEHFRDQIIDTNDLLLGEIGKKRILLEGAQGILLSVLHGSYPFVTSSDCTLAGLASGADIDRSLIDYTYVVLKAPYMTRVGQGPFPTEMGGAASAAWCGHSETTQAVEQKVHPLADINSAEEFEQGVAIRRLGGEYGATTGRPRRVGWLDLPLLRHALTCGGGFDPERTGLVLTKLDVMDTAVELKICIEYCYEGDAYRVGGRTLSCDNVLDVAIMDAHVLERVGQVYRALPGWNCSLKGIRSEDELPAEVRAFVDAVEPGSFRVDLISTGPGRDEVVVMR